MQSVTYPFDDGAIGGDFTGQQPPRYLRGATTFPGIHPGTAATPATSKGQHAKEPLSVAGAAPRTLPWVVAVSVVPFRLRGPKGQEPPGPSQDTMVPQREPSDRNVPSHPRTLRVWAPGISHWYLYHAPRGVRRPQGPSQGRTCPRDYASRLPGLSRGRNLAPSQGCRRISDISLEVGRQGPLLVGGTAPDILMRGDDGPMDSPRIWAAPGRVAGALLSPSGTLPVIEASQDPPQDPSSDVGPQGSPIGTYGLTALPGAATSPGILPGRSYVPGAPQSAACSPRTLLPPRVPKGPGSGALRGPPRGNGANRGLCRGADASLDLLRGRGASRDPSTSGGSPSTFPLVSMQSVTDPLTMGHRETLTGAAAPLDIFRGATMFPGIHPGTAATPATSKGRRHRKEPSLGPALPQGLCHGWWRSQEPIQGLRGPKGQWSPQGPSQG
ncbi:collagen alpha-2(I) chain-like [Homarus americanus]|uniref:collagen alpha-2(I) chain-like n=1 Tax=Homarus americanus TaxID=6706 RepID=UPI001C48273A|nr:collagen alpha-2(I) chain-like [Homarus americanus]